MHTLGFSELKVSVNTKLGRCFFEINVKLVKTMQYFN